MHRKQTDSQRQLNDLWDKLSDEDNDNDNDNDNDSNINNNNNNNNNKIQINNNNNNNNNKTQPSHIHNTYTQNNHQHRREKSQSQQKIFSNLDSITNNNNNNNNNNILTYGLPRNISYDDYKAAELDMRFSHLQKLDTDGKAKILARYLEKVPLLARLSLKERHQLGLLFRDRSYPKGMEIIRQGDKGDEFYIIIQGEASVSMYNADKEKKEDVAILKPGDYFGETALLTTNPRNATVRALDTVVVLVLDKDSFHRTFGEDRIRVNFGKRGAISTDDMAPKKRLQQRRPSRAKTDKSEAIKELIATAVENNVLFEALDPDQIARIVEVMWELEVKKGYQLIAQGEPGDNFYVVESGVFDVYVSNKGGPEKLIATRTAQESFGELALMYNSPRSATVRARTDCKVWAVERYMFRKILIRLSDEKLAEYERFLREVPLLDSLLSNERRAVAEALDEVKYRKGDIIIRQGDPGDTFYIIRKGTAVVYKADRRAQPPQPAKEVKRLARGEFFGERALIKNDVRAATVKADEDMTCLCLDREAFALLLGPLAELMKRKIDEEYDADINAKSGDTTKNVKNAKNQKMDNSNEFEKNDNNGKFRLHIPKNELITVGILGKGSFGSVELVKHKKTGKTYALKQVSKQQIVETGQQEHIINEKNVQMLLDSQFVVKLYQTYKDKKYLYLLLEVVLGGELFTVLRARTVFDEATAKFYTASVVSAFDYMHSKDIVYRDLKPENLLLNDKGYLKIADFGFAKIIQDWDRTYTLCGTPDYLAPEIISGVGHGKGVDWWTLGVLIFEMLASYPPFVDEDPMKTYAKIMLGEVKYPKHFSESAIEIIRGFLVAKPTKRLGIIHGGASRIHHQAWFKGFDWDALFEGTEPAPIIPKIAGDEDRSNFEVGIYTEIDDEDEDYEDDGTGWDEQF